MLRVSSWEQVVYSVPANPALVVVMYCISSSWHKRYISMPGSMPPFVRRSTGNSTHRYECWTMWDQKGATQGTPSSRLRIVFRISS